MPLRGVTVDASVRGCLDEGPGIARDDRKM